MTFVFVCIDSTQQWILFFLIFLPSPVSPLVLDLHSTLVSCDSVDAMDPFWVGWFLSECPVLTDVSALFSFVYPYLREGFVRT
jgi:hypothetical protein